MNGEAQKGTDDRRMPVVFTQSGLMRCFVDWESCNAHEYWSEQRAVGRNQSERRHLNWKKDGAVNF